MKGKGIIFWMTFMVYAFLNAQQNNPYRDSISHFLRRTASVEWKEAEWKTFQYFLRKLPLREADSLLEDFMRDNNRINIDLMGRMYDFRGVLQRRMNRFADAARLHKRALFFLKNTTDTMAIIKAYNNLGVALHKQNLENEAFENFVKAKTLADKIGSLRNQAIALHGMANIFIDLGDYKRAIRYLRQSLAIERKRNNPVGIEYNYANFAEAYMQLHRFDSARYYMDKALDLAGKLYGKKLGVEYNLAGKMYYLQGDYPAAIEYFRKSLQDVESRNIRRYMANDYVMLGKALDKMGHSREGKTYLEKGLKLATGIRSRENIIEALDGLADYYANRGDFNKALNLQREKERYKDSMLNINSLQSINSLEVLNKVREKDRYINRLEQEKERERRRSVRNMRLAVGVGVLSLIFIGLLWYVFHLRRKNAHLELEELNREIQRYLMEIQELKSKTPDTKIPITDQMVQEYDLTRREEDILQMILKGYRNKEIADKLYISLNTVKTHIRHIYEKLNVRNRMEVIQKLKKETPAG